MFGIIIPVLSSFILSAVIVGLVLYISHKKSWYDTIDERKIHSGDVPRLGGVGFAAAFIAVAFVINFLATENHYGLRFLPVLFAMLLILVFGVYDDFRPLAPRVKLGIQIIAAFCVILPGYSFQRLFLDGDFLLNLKWIWYPLCLLWIVGLTNAINLIDGVDGLAGGVSALIALSYAAIFAIFFPHTGNTVTLFGLCLAAAIGGFLIFNLPFPKAKIFMGDGGSQFLGFLLALLPLIGARDSGPDIPLLYAAALMLIPIFDTVAAVWRRLRDGRRIDSPDKHHIHHKLMNLGLRAKGVIGVLYLLQIITGILVFFSVQKQGLQSLIILGIAYLTGAVFFIIIHYMNKAALKRQGINNADGDTFSEAAS